MTFFRKAIFFCLLFSVFFNAISQEKKTSGSIKDKALKVFLDCHYCDSDYLRRTVPYVNYVRNRTEADVHILVTRQSTGSGGREYGISLIGQGEYEGINNEISYTSTPDETRDVTRQGRTRMIAIGLMQYVAKTPLANKIDIIYANGEEVAEGLSETMVIDNWDSWVFDIDMNGEFEEQESYSTPQLEADFKVERVTPGWKLEFGTSYDYFLRLYRYEDTTYRSTRTRYSFSHLTVKSLNDHWSAGGRAYVSADSYQNRKFAWSIYPAVEYNVFRYQESSKKQLRFQYRVGYGYSYYQDTTIYNKTEEGLFGQQLSIAYEIRQPWGSINTSLQGFNYLHDFSKNNLRLRSWLYFRIYKGLSLNVSGNVSLIHDQLSLQKAEATEEEVLLRQRQLATQYSYSFKIGFSYTFGSIYNNVVNPRFGDR